jgi:hypothetical protein
LEYRKQQGRGAVDMLLFCTLGGILIVVLFYVQRVTREAKGIEMKAELQNIRTAINAYRAQNGNRRPETLRVLVAEKYIQKDERDPFSKQVKRHYLKVYALDHEGYPVDPFGNRYRYNPGTGDVGSGTEGYESW